MLIYTYLIILLALNNDATISCVLYANTNHPELRNEFPIWADRFKQILKKWRALSTEQKAPYLAKARENRSAIRMKKAQHVRKCIFFKYFLYGAIMSLLRVTLIETNKKLLLQGALLSVLASCFIDNFYLYKLYLPFRGAILVHLFTSHNGPKSRKIGSKTTILAIIHYQELRNQIIF